MNYLPYMKYSDSIQENTQSVFGGLNHRSGASDGEIYNMKNLTSDEYPLLTSRLPRSSSKVQLNGIYALDGLLTVEGTSVKYKGKKVGTVKDDEKTKTISALGSKIVILPDKVYYDTADEDGTLIPIEAKWEGEATIGDGEYAGVDAKANTIKRSDTTTDEFTTLFKVGDAVTISGDGFVDNNITIIIREISTNELRFYENSFTVNEATTPSPLTLTISRKMPDMDFICENDNRLWGCKGDTVYASKLGDVTNWNVFDGLASDSYAVDVGSPGDFTGCITYLGYPIFFKEDVIYKVYGSLPSNFELIRSASLGVAKGSHKSLAIAGEICFYMSRTGIVAYSGSTPQDVFLSFGLDKYSNAVGGSDGRKYYVSMQDKNEEWILAVYDTSFNMWHIEDNTKAIAMVYNDALYMATEKELIKVSDENANEDNIESIAEFAPFTYGTQNKKGVSKIGIRCETETNATVSVQIKYDSKGEWQQVSTLSAPTKRSFYLPVIPRRCDHFSLRFVGKGKWRLCSITKEYYYGSKN